MSFVLTSLLITVWAGFMMFYRERQPDYVPITKTIFEVEISEPVIVMYDRSRRGCTNYYKHSSVVTINGVATKIIGADKNWLQRNIKEHIETQRVIACNNQQHDPELQTYATIFSIGLLTSLFGFILLI